MARRAQVRARPHNRKYTGGGKAKKSSGGGGDGGGGALVEIDWGTFDVILPSGKPGAVVVVRDGPRGGFEEHWFLAMRPDESFDPWIRPGAGNPRVDVTFKYRSADTSVPPTTTQLPKSYQQWRHVTGLVKSV